MHYAGLFSKAAYEKINDSPIFQCGELFPLNDQEMEFARQEILDEHDKSFRKTPFPVFSILMKASGIELENVSIVVWSIPSNDKILQCDVDERDKAISFRCPLKLIFTGQLGGADLCLLMRYKSGPVNKDGIAITPYYNWKLFEPEMTHAKRETLSHMAANTRGSALRLIFDMLNPANAILRVEPNRIGKSAHWTKAHTHYCIINKSQAQKCQLGKRGPTDHELVRAAHWRRAHMRRLMSDKFKNKQGQLVFVRQSWVGPEEWIGTDKKIYKVINTKQP